MKHKSYQKSLAHAGVVGVGVIISYPIMTTMVGGRGIGPVAGATLAGGIAAFLISFLADTVLDAIMY